MTLQEALSAYLNEHDMSQRALSLSAGLNAKAVSDILTIPGIRPRHSTLARLSAETGLDLIALADFSVRSYADLVGALEKRRAQGLDIPKVERQIKRIKWLLRKTGWVGQTRAVCRADVLDFFARSTPAEVGLTPGSFATYKSEILGALDEAGGRARLRGVMDIGGIWAELRDEIRVSEMKQDLKLASGPFLVYLADHKFQPFDVTEATLLDYFHARNATGSKSEEKCRKHVKRIAKLLCVLADDPRFTRFGCKAVRHPFPDGRDKFGVSDAEISGLLDEWDKRVTPWARGQISRDGQTRTEFIASLDAQHEMSEEQVRRRARRARRNKRQITGSTRRDNLLRRHGFLTKKDQWSEKTAVIRRGYVASLVKAYVAATEQRIETVADLTDPNVLEDAIGCLTDANADSEFDSDYAAGILKTVRKVAAGFVERSEQDLVEIGELIEEYASGRRGIAARNKAKLRQFTPERIQTTIDLTDQLVAHVNRTVEARRKTHRRKHGVLPRSTEVYDRELARDVMVALAHSIMMKRGPRSANLIGIRLNWIRWQNDLATIVIPSTDVKMRGKSDPDLLIPLGISASRLLRGYLDKIREKALQPGDEQNPYLFPGQDRKTFQRNQPYRGILQRLARRVHKIVGVRINPHLYRHLIGWFWLKEDVNNLPKVQKLLGHKSLQTTIDHYAEIDEELALDSWQQWLERRAA